MPRLDFNGFLVLVPNARAKKNKKSLQSAGAAVRFTAGDGWGGGGREKKVHLLAI